MAQTGPQPPPPPPPPVPPPVPVGVPPVPPPVPPAAESIAPDEPSCGTSEVPLPQPRAQRARAKRVNCLECMIFSLPSKPHTHVRCRRGAGPRCPSPQQSEGLARRPPRRRRDHVLRQGWRGRRAGPAEGEEDLRQIATREVQPLHAVPDRLVRRQVAGAQEPVP